jgi:cobalt-zinc-cadmium efflux system membrane fusion protein
MPEKSLNTDTAQDATKVHPRIEFETDPSIEYPATGRRGILFIIGIAVLTVVVILSLLVYGRRSQTSTTEEKTSAVATGQGAKIGEAADKEAKESSESQEVALEADALKAAGIEIAGVTVRPAVALMTVTGSVEANQQQTQSATPLVSGRVERVYVALGDHVRLGAVLATIASPEVAEMRGKLRAAQNSLALAQSNLERVERSENRVAVLSAKAKLDEADANLKRTRRLIDLGVGAGKDILTAETAYKTARAEYDFQSNIALNREVQEAQAQVATARVEIEHLRESLRAIGADGTGSLGNTSLIAVRAPVSGAVTERLVNPGAGVESGKPLFTIGNLSTVWVIANVPEAQLGALHVGTPAEIQSAALSPTAISARVSYIDPQLDESTRTAKVRLNVPNTGERLKAGMFVEVGLQAGTAQGGGEELVISSEAVQKIG